MRSENVDFTCVLSMFFRFPLGRLKYHHVPCRVRLGAILGGFGSYLGRPWGILCHVGAILKEFGSYFVELLVT